MEFIRNTKSVCPNCLKSIGAKLYRQNNEILLIKSCKNHGEYKTVVWRGEPTFEEWENRFAHPKNPSIQRLQPLSLSTQNPCPHKCGICSEHEQSTCTVLFELTETCNLACPICFASSQNKRTNDFESLDLIVDKLKWIQQNAGAVILQLSGGEPTLHPELCSVVKEAIKLFPAVQLNTNGIILGQNESYALELKKSGLSWVFLQFDALSDDINKKIRGASLLDIKVKAIENCKKAGLSVVLVTTLVRDVNDHILGNLIDFAISKFPVVKGLHIQPMTLSGRNLVENQTHITLPEVIKKLSEQTENVIKLEHALASDCEHARCSFHARYYINDNRSMEYVKNSRDKKLQGNDSISLANAPERSINSVIRSWENIYTETSKIVSTPLKDSNFTAFDEFIEKSKKQIFSITCMAFQDVFTLDLDRLKQCCVHIYSSKSDKHRLVPFCSYNLTSIEGRGLYRSYE